MAGKLVSHGGVNAFRPGPLVFLQDHTTCVYFLADSGAAVSMIPGPTSTNSNTSTSLTATNGEAIAFGKEMQLTIRFKDDRGSLHQFPFSFLQGDVDGPILGSDFLWRYCLSVNLAASLLHRQDGRIFSGSQSLSLSSPVFSAIPSDIQPIISSFTHVCSSSTAMPPPAMGVQHFIIIIYILANAGLHTSNCTVLLLSKYWAILRHGKKNG